ncbi:probable xyloglucan endotransglucosylase/hydrolase protein 32 [Andrographis paniculata]|uniref:probable xyloglucan endotransglucosylase/hydrolase protein 32 n=1 Tax=Andrographis paniculata TaxID=175694 RepID=UPI0021E7B287|nr:probable xyloglucan endotransglucosylase/hydrolase protein 32 [Andrographis paniculata]
MALQFHLIINTVLLLLLLLLIILLPLAHGGQRPPSPGYYPSSRFRSMSFRQGYRNLWGPNHLSFDNNGINIWLDRNSGSGFKSVKPFRSGYFGASIKLQPGYTAGVITAFYLSNNEAHPGNHDEVDIEFLGTTFGKPYTLQTNVYVRGSGDGRIIGREMKFHLWFDPTQSFHHYAILWSPREIIFLVDDVPIRRYPRKSDATFPLRPMWVYGSIWDASSWATEDGKYKADYRYQPFIGKFSNFKATGCSAYAPARCRSVSASPARSGRLTWQQNRAMQWVQRHYMVYNYCFDHKRNHALTPECWT